MIPLIVCIHSNKIFHNMSPFREMRNAKVKTCVRHRECIDQIVVTMPYIAKENYMHWRYKIKRVAFISVMRYSVKGTHNTISLTFDYANITHISGSLVNQP